MGCHSLWAEVVIQSQCLTTSRRLIAGVPACACRRGPPSQNPAYWGSSPTLKGICSQSLQERNCSHSCRRELWGLYPKCREGLGALKHQEKSSTARNHQERDSESQGDRADHWRRQTLYSLLKYWAWPPLDLLVFTVFPSGSLVSQGKNWFLKCV